MENALFTNVKKLYDHQLYECVIPPASLLSTLLQKDRNIATLEMEYQVQLYLANSNYKERHFRIAMRQLDDLLYQRRTMIRYKNACLVAIESAYAQFTDVELRRRLADCYKEIGEFAKAIATLNTIPVKLRTPRVNLMLARLQHRGRGSGTMGTSIASLGCRNKKEAILAYKDVVRDCPMALQAIDALLELGVDGNEVNSLVMSAGTTPNNIDWLITWIKGLAQLYDCDHKEAAHTFLSLNDGTQLRRNEHLLVAIGKCYYYHGTPILAAYYLATAVARNPNNMEAVGLLSLAYDVGKMPESEQERERLYVQVAAEREFTAGHWFIHALKMNSIGKYERGLDFVERCLDMESHHLEGLLLRARMLSSLERFTEAVVAYRVVQTVAPFRFEIYKGLFHCYVSLRRIKEAEAMCTWSIRCFRSSPRSYTMMGRTLFHFCNREKVKISARRFAEKALKIDPDYAPAVALLAEIYKEEGELKSAIKLLETHVERAPCADLFRILGDIMSSEKQSIKALEYYYLALGLDSKDPQALMGIEALKSSGIPDGSSSDDKRSTSSSSFADTSSAGGQQSEPDFVLSDNYVSQILGDPVSSPALSQHGDGTGDIDVDVDVDVDVAAAADADADPNAHAAEDADADRLVEGEVEASDTMTETLWHDADTEMNN
ncbi:anaphase-promoting complex subunit 7 [Drosophila bipectinata]|uniref:anaphase-promoting complex subunit 7 n=1 Tax=Drosophila bipectinata TaxID=42026 RepID=UPI001C89F70C|nr:anaphase-promoting complex subunit 7 [Drosophila bipectinata]